MMFGGTGWIGRSMAGDDDDELLGSAYNHKVVTNLLKYVGPFRTQALIAIVSTVIYTASLVAIPWIIALGIDQFVQERNLKGLNVLTIALAITATINWLSNYVQQISMAKVSQGVLYELRRHMFDHLQKLSISFYDKSEVGRIMSRVQNDVNQLNEFLSMAIQTMGDVLSLGGIIIALLVMDLTLGLITITVMPVLIIIMAIWQRYARSAFMRVRRAISIVNGALQENMAGVRVVQSMNREDTNLHLFDEKNREHLNANLQASRLAAGLLPVVDTLTGVAIGLVVIFGGHMVLTNTLAIGALVAYVLYIQRFFDPIRNLTIQYTMFQRAMTSGLRIFDLLSVKPDIIDSKDAQEMPPIKGNIKFQDVYFGYTPKLKVLKNINLEIKVGETVALVGPTGAGKTSIVSLISRFYEVNQGSILIDDIDIRNVKRRSISSQMSMVLQEPFLFSGTIADNIKYNRVDSSMEDVITASKLVNAHEFITKLENGYETFLEERGGNLSMGQRQLLSFARAIVADPKILILDEATANIDSHTEVLIQKALKTILKNRTAIIIAHRLSTIRGADKIIVIDQGQIKEIGSHQHLIDQNGLYSHLYNMNFTILEGN